MARCVSADSRSDDAGNGSRKTAATAITIEPPHQPTGVDHPARSLRMPVRQCHSHTREWDIDQEHRPPAQPQRIGVHQRTAEHRTGHAREPGDRAVEAEGSGTRPLRKCPGDDGDGLGGCHCGGYPCHTPGQHQFRWTRGDSAPYRGSTEGGQRGREHDMPPEQITDPGGGRQHTGENQPVSAHDQQFGRRTRPEIPGQRGHCGVHDGQIQHLHEDRDQAGRQGNPRTGRPCRSSWVTGPVRLPDGHDSAATRTA
ncbi:MAG: hypothetical protein JWN03_545 [Nocardia sp.]|nr:hypothetical protein [Nocardia sp.]